MQTTFDYRIKVQDNQKIPSYIMYATIRDKIIIKIFIG